MTDREKLIALLHKCVRCPGVVTTCEVDCPYWSNETACDEFGATVDMLFANGVTVQRWIPVTERLPGTEKVLITDGDIVKGGYKRPDGVWKYGVEPHEKWERLSLKPVTHWMPLPEPPKEGE